MNVIDLNAEPRRVAEVLARYRSRNNDAESRAREIVEAVRWDGDEAVTTFTRQFDCRFIDSLGLRLSHRELYAAFENISPPFLKSLRIAKADIISDCKRQRLKSSVLKRKGMKVESRVEPLSRVGICVGGGKAFQPSRVLMSALPAKVAGVAEIVLAVQCNEEGRISDETLVAARECGITEIYRISGAQAVAAFAFGTESIRRVDKIAGCDNALGAAAKILVCGEVGIDMAVGSEDTIILADESANSAVVCADLIALAERGETTSLLLIVISSALAQRVKHELKARTEHAEGRLTGHRTLHQHGTIAIVKSMRHAMELVNDLAPARVVLQVKESDRAARQVKNAGVIFIGPWASHVLGEYALGGNAILPTGGTSRFASALSVADFMRSTLISKVTRAQLQKLAYHAGILTDTRGLQRQVSSPRIRQR